MSSGNHRDPAKEQFWRRLLGQWRCSGLSVRAFCQEHDLSDGRATPLSPADVENRQEGPDCSCKKVLGLA
jgi:hypothetical protein